MLLRKQSNTEDLMIRASFIWFPVILVRPMELCNFQHFKFIVMFIVLFIYLFVPIYISN